MCECSYLAVGFAIAFIGCLSYTEAFGTAPQLMVLWGSLIYGFVVAVQLKGGLWLWVSYPHVYELTESGHSAHLRRSNRSAEWRYHTHTNRCTHNACTPTHTKQHTKA
jgi:hypothetical protein